MILYSCKALHFAALTAFAYVGIFVYWHGYTQQMLARNSHLYFHHEWPNSTISTNKKLFVRRMSGAGATERIPNQTQADIELLHVIDAKNQNGIDIIHNNSDNSANIVQVWNDDNKLDLIYDAMKTYCRKSIKEIDVVHGLGIGAVLEMVDPMGGRNFGCLAQYFYNWTYTNSSGQDDDLPRFPVFESFFDWLDFGKGRDVQLIDMRRDGNQTIDCPRSDFDLKRHRKFTATERARTEIQLVDARNETNGHGIVNVSFAQSHVPLYNGEWLLTWGPDRKMYVLDERWGNDGDGFEPEDPEEERIHYGHATFFCGRPVLFAGLVYVVNNGTVAWISMSSGHYKPTLPYMLNFYEFLRDEKSINVTAIEWREHSNESLDVNWVETVGKNASYGTYAYD
jgi:hypothetical protein